MFKNKTKKVFKVSRIVKFCACFFVILLSDSCETYFDSEAAVVTIKDEGVISAIEIIDFEIKDKVSTKIYPVRSHKILSSNEAIILYGKYENNSNLDRITQIIYQNNEDHLEFSFDDQNNLVAITNYDLATNTVVDKVLLKNDNSNFYLSRNDVTEQLERGGFFSVEEFSGDLVNEKLNELFTQNTEMFSYLNGADGISSKVSGTKKTAIVPPVIIGVIAVATVIAAIKIIGIKNITKGTVIESDNLSDLLDKACSNLTNKGNTFKFADTNNSNYLCNASTELDNARDTNSSLDLCYKVNNNEVTKCYPIELVANNITDAGLADECYGGPWNPYYLDFNYLDPNNKVLNDLSNLKVEIDFERNGCYYPWTSIGTSNVELVLENYSVTFNSSNIIVPFAVSLGDNNSDWAEIRLYFIDLATEERISNYAVYRVERNVNYP